MIFSNVQPKLSRKHRILLCNINKQIVCRVSEGVHFYTGLIIAVNSIECLLKFYKKKEHKFTNWVLAQTAKEPSTFPLYILSKTMNDSIQKCGFIESKNYKLSSILRYVKWDLLYYFIILIFML